MCVVYVMYVRACYECVVGYACLRLCICFLLFCMNSMYVMSVLCVCSVCYVGKFRMHVCKFCVYMV